jgi:hypothetical protein
LKGTNGQRAWQASARCLHSLNGRTSDYGTKLLRQAGWLLLTVGWVWVGAVILEVKPPRNGEIEFEDIRTLFYKLRDQGMNLKWISFDTFQSVDSMQILRQKGFITGERSMDKTSLPYDVTKTAFYDGRVKAPKHDKALSEIVRLERDPQSGKIDHPPHFSKDCADAVAGVVFGLTYRREPWVRYSVPIKRSLEEVVRAIEQKSDAGRGERHTERVRG